MQVVDQIDTLTSDLQLEEEMTDSSKTDTLNSSSSSTTASSLEKIKMNSDLPVIKAALNPSSSVLTVLKKPNPPPPPPRLTPLKTEDPHRSVSMTQIVKASRTVLHNGVSAGATSRVPNGDVFCIPGSDPDRGPIQTVLHKPEKDRCQQTTATTTRERVRFSEKVQYHGYCPDCDVQYDMKNRDVHLHMETIQKVVKPPHHCPPSPPPLPPLQNGQLNISSSNSFPPVRPATVPPSTAPKPQKTILRKSTTTTV
ncbi:protein Largen [Protopterus annectens]|uniref:protein Largen n=1 Tax=Protopterus annectens TaxID=7888 RepID=UPI001CF95584|nr:protein Largen [Protopterus annectens]